MVGLSAGPWKQSLKGLRRPELPIPSSRRSRLRNLRANQCILCQKNLDSRQLGAVRLERQYLKSLLRPCTMQNDQNYGQLEARTK